VQAVVAHELAHTLQFAFGGYYLLPGRLGVESEADALARGWKFDGRDAIDRWLRKSMDTRPTLA
jgi:hypothetical protein